MVDQYNLKINRKDMYPRGTANGKSGQLHVVAVKEMSLSNLKKLDCAPYAGYKKMQFQL